MNSENARRILEAARAKAAEIGKPVSLAIVNAGGTLVALDRFNDPPSFTLQVAEGKAVASAVMGMDSGRVAGLAQNLPAITNALAARHAGRFVAHQGAVVVRDGSGVAGAIGVSGATSEEDETIARAGIWQARSTTVVLGGESALGNSLSAAGQDMLVAAARRNGHEPLNAAQFENLKPKATLALAEAAPGGLVALVSSGGSVLALGTCVDAYRVPTGVVLGRLPCEGGVPGLIHDFAARGIPVVHILNVKRLALEWGLPLDPKPLPSIGQNARVYGPAAFAKSN